MTQQSAVALNSDSVKALLRDHRTREDVLDAVLALHESGRVAHAMGEAAAARDLADVFRWADALGRMLACGEGMVLLACYRRANDLIFEAQQDGTLRFDEKPQPSLYRQKEERELAVAMAMARREAEAAFERGDFDAAMRAVGCLRPYMQAFYDKVSLEPAIVELQENRLRLVNELRAVIGVVGDLSKIEDRLEAA